MPDFARGLPKDADPWETIQLLRLPGNAARMGLDGDPEGPIRLLEYWIGSVDEKEWRTGGRPISTISPQQAMIDPGSPDTSPPAISPAAFAELQPVQARGQGRMPPSIRDALALVEKFETMTEAERDALEPANIDHWLAALAVSRMPVPLARFMPPLGRLDCNSVIAATKQALPEFRISRRVWKTLCRRQDEFGAVIAVCITVNEILEHPGPVPEELPDKILKQLSTHEGTTAFIKSRELKGEKP